MKTTCTCKHCSSVFVTDVGRSRKGVFCSRECARITQTKAVQKPCGFCGNQMTVKLCLVERKKFCCKKCMAEDYKLRRGVETNHYVGRVGYGPSREYYACRMVDHPRADKRGYIMEHRLVMEKALGRYLERWEVVHHIDGNGQNNALENLQVMTKRAHDNLHHKQRWDRYKTAQRAV